ncbi:cysteine desulfurase [Rodentibacter trehalosifermentans]|uniref:Probable cysteine desulfurase n=1 Tax=Rodentibacter trehalosifermentans TaxID=1908263 RepID=A0A1V3J1F4_9PAST|nr:cysteine desulfurase [Rodentibacter trehalosifermentans]OOF45677.1 cysteine desulfurase [Rodentibacter trehalosifermentans]OOF48586.1 cysteine desulfurase [Rodentibacter trehalosifermentans]OOF52609.1 cysteine desulfurase [Rodentibacter trehalosifermentans]
MAFDYQLFKAHFPYFKTPNASVYLDNAATALKPNVLIERTAEFYASAGSVHRSQYDAQQTAQYEKTRTQVKSLINAEDEKAVIWTSGTTHAINLVANGLLPHLKPGDEILISQADHHANFVTWYETAKKCGAKVRILPMLDNWLIDESALKNALNERTKLVALNFVSNVTGTEQPVKRLIQTVRQNSNALVLVDAAQAISHIKIDVQDLDVDFLAFSAHKLYGPNGLGVLSGKLTALSRLQPLFFGGKMVDRVSLEAITFADLPYRLEAGTPNIAGVIGFNAVLDWLTQWDSISAEQHAIALAESVKVRLKNETNCRLFNSPQPSSIVCFVFNGIDSSDLATLLSEQHIALRVGEHCAQPYLARLGERTTLRLSFAPYNTPEDVAQFFAALDKALELLQ